MSEQTDKNKGIEEMYCPYCDGEMSYLYTRSHIKNGPEVGFCDDCGRASTDENCYANTKNDGGKNYD